MPEPAPTRAEVVVDLTAIRRNVELLTALAARTGAATMAVVKADGYGHGAVDVARAAVAGGASWLGVTSTPEAMALRDAGLTQPVLSWLNMPGEDFTAAIEADIDLSVASPSELKAMIKAAASAGRPARIHLKIDTGLSRNGCQPHGWPDLVEQALAARNEGQVDIVGVWSHLACADEPDRPENTRQRERFEQAYELVRAAGPRPLRHLANSAATLALPDFHYDLVRLGIAMYGLDPLDGSVDHGLSPAMTFQSRVAMVKRIPAGEGVSYGHVWHAERDTNLALVPVGYADGVPRGLSGRLRVLLAGRSRPVVGRISMDQLMVDCGDDQIAEGERVILFGPGRHGEQTAADWADALDTIHFEILTNMGRRSRVSRVITGRGDAPG